MEPFDKTQNPAATNTSDQPVFVAQARPQNTLGFKIFVGFFWLMLVSSVLLTIAGISAGGGAGFVLLVSVPGILVSVCTLATIYTVVWRTNRKQPVVAAAQATEEDAAKKVRTYTWLAIVCSVATVMITAASIGMGLSLFANPQSDSTSWLLTSTILVIGPALGLLGIIGAALSLRATHIMTSTRRYTLAALFLTGMWLSPIVGMAIVPLASTATESRVADGIKRLPFDPLVPTDSSGFMIYPYGLGGPTLQAHEQLSYAVIDASYKDRRGSFTPSYATIIMKKARQDSQKSVSAECSGQCERFTTPQGTEVSIIDQTYAFEKAGLQVRIYDSEKGMLQRDRAGNVSLETVNRLIDGLKAITPEQLAEQYMD